MTHPLPARATRYPTARFDRNTLSQQQWQRQHYHQLHHQPSLLPAPSWLAGSPAAPSRVSPKTQTNGLPTVPPPAPPFAPTAIASYPYHGVDPRDDPYASANPVLASPAAFRDWAVSCAAGAARATARWVEDVCLATVHLFDRGALRAHATAAPASTTLHSALSPPPFDPSDGGSSDGGASEAAAVDQSYALVQAVSLLNASHATITFTTSTLSAIALIAMAGAIAGTASSQARHKFECALAAASFSAAGVTYRTLQTRARRGSAATATGQRQRRRAALPQLDLLRRRARDDLGAAARSQRRGGRRAAERRRRL